MISATNRTKLQNFFLIFILGLLNTIGPFSIDMYLPAFPQIAYDLQTTIQNIALSVSSYFLGFALGQILYGPLLDRFGRKRPIFIGLIFYIIATIICCTSNSVNSLLIIRFFQAIGGCVGSVAAMTMVRDFFPVDKSASIISFLILTVGLSPLLAPSVGSLVVVTLGWRYVFVALACIAAVILLLVIFILPEGHKPDTSISLKPKPIISGFKTILIMPQFYVYTLTGTFLFAGLFVYVAGSPAIFMDEFQVSATTYGGIFALLSVGLIGSSQLNHILTKKFKTDKILNFVAVTETVASIFYFICVTNGWCALTGNLIFLFVILSCAGLSYPNAAAIALMPFTKNAGRASALLGFIQLGIGGLISSAVGLLHSKGSLPTSATMAAASVIGFVILLIGKTKTKVVMNVDLNAESVHY